MIRKTPVVVTGGSANALGVLRSLAHCDLTLLCDSTQATAWHSRHGRKVKGANTRAVSVVDDLLALAARLPAGERPVLILTEEKTVVHVSQARERLAPHFRFLLCEASLLSDLQSKEGFQRLAQQAGSPVPQGAVLRSAADLPTTRTLQYPCVFKPLEQDATYASRFKKAYKVASADEVAALYREIEPVMPHMIVQEWLDGEDSDIYFCLGFWDQQSNLVGESFTGRKVRSWPLQVGGTASCTSAPEAAAELTRLTNAFAQATGYVGQMGMEFKHDVRRGGFYMVEPTVGRTDYQHEIATLSGCNVLDMMVEHLAGAPVGRSGPAQAVVWYDEVSDAKALAAGAPDRLFSDRPRVAAVWRPRDPMPTLADLAQRASGRLRRLLGG
ncbi:hypothetical protein [Hydrogenophaga sp.]|uniref:carboxylate--amine ligase n=1 Tax=Hydrogenophaga sp. TaxID=1904254 RepID=UPI00286E9508|nr:hypothetical protein [Hydrogenophaga sp.]